MKLTLVLILLCGSLSALANEKGNGGDICEMRIQTIGADLKSWISNGGADALSLPSGVSKYQYATSMLKALANTKVSCVDQTLMVGAAEKTCKNFSSANGTQLILCNINRFLNQTSESDQYVLVHHEYAGVAGFETNRDEASNYAISNQITGFLEDQVVKKLVVRPKPSADGSCRGDQLTSSDVLRAMSPGMTSVALFGGYRVYSTSRYCNTQTGCAAWSQESVVSSGSYSASIADDGQVVLDFGLDKATCSNVSPESVVGCRFDKALDTSGQYTFHPSTLRKNCLDLSASKTEVSAGPGSTKETRLTFRGIHSTENGAISPAFPMGQKFSVNMSCTHSWWDVNDPSRGSTTATSEVQSVTIWPDHTVDLGSFANKIPFDAPLRSAFYEESDYSPIDHQLNSEFKANVNISGDVLTVETSNRLRGHAGACRGVYFAK